MWGVSSHCMWAVSSHCITKINCHSSAWVWLIHLIGRDVLQMRECAKVSAKMCMWWLLWVRNGGKRQHEFEFVLICFVGPSSQLWSEFLSHICQGCQCSRWATCGLDILQSCHDHGWQDDRLTWPDVRCWTRLEIDRWTILPVIQLESQWRFTSFRHELVRQTVSVTGWNQHRDFLWSCALGVALCSVPLSSSVWWKHCALLTILMTVKKRSGHLDHLEKACCVQFYKWWQWIVRNEQLISWGSGQFWSKCTSAWFIMSFSFVTHTGNCFGETL